MTKFKTLVADPPWSYRNKKTGGSMRSGSAAKYPTMSVDDISALDVRSVMDTNSVCFLWGTTPMLPEVFHVLKSWGYNYKTMLYWHKIGRLGLGYWFRGNVEVCLFGIRGKVKAFRCPEPNVIQTIVRKHSQKPDEFYSLVEPVVPFPALELFAARRREGWSCVGYEANSQSVEDFLGTGKVV